jgi:hypothetical protein
MQTPALEYLQSVKTAVQVVDNRKLLGSILSPVAGTVGRVGNLVTGAPTLGTLRGALHTANPEHGRALDAVYEARNEPPVTNPEEDTRSTMRKAWDYVAGNSAQGPGELKIEYGAPSIIDGLKRVWTRPGLSLPGRVLGTPVSLATDALSSVARMDNYSPFSHRITAYTDEPAVIAHELGHAEDYGRSKIPTIRAFARGLGLPALYDEAVASRKGVSMLNEAQQSLAEAPTADWDRLTGSDRVSGILGAGFGSYVGGVAGGNALLGSIGGHALGRAIHPFGDVVKRTQQDSPEMSQEALDATARRVHLEDAQRRHPDLQVEYANDQQSADGELRKAAGYVTDTPALEYLRAARTARFA